MKLSQYFKVFAIICLYTMAEFSFAQEINFELLKQRGQKTLEQFSKKSAAWTAIHSVNKRTFLLEITTGINKRHTTLYGIGPNGQKVLFVQILERNGIWYVVEPGGIKGKYRPYEADLKFPLLYMFLAYRDPPVVVENQGKSFLVKDKIAFYRTPHAEPVARQIRDAIQQMNSLLKKGAPAHMTMQIRSQLEQLQKMLQDGMQMKIDTTTGIIVESGHAARSFVIRNFRWLEKEKSELFAIPTGKLTDTTSDPTINSDNIMISFAPWWKPGMPTRSVDLHTCLFNLKNGQIRRIPYVGGGTTYGCFSKDRTHAYIPAQIEAQIGIFDINLKTGENILLGEELAGQTLFPSLSPDGNKLVVINRAPGMEILQTQIYTIDLTTNKIKKIGKPMDSGPVSWFPDGKGFLAVDRKYVTMDKPADETVCHIALDGSVTKLIAGSSPIILDKKRILYQGKDRLWYSCDFKGKNSSLFLDGLKSHGFPCSDGKRLLMIHFDGKAPRPMLYNLKTGKGKKIVNLSGLLGYPRF